MNYEEALKYAESKQGTPKSSLAECLGLLRAFGGGGLFGLPIAHMYDHFLSGISDPAAQILGEVVDSKIRRDIGLGADFDGDVASIYPSMDTNSEQWYHFRYRLASPYCKDALTAREWLEHEQKREDDETAWVFGVSASTYEGKGKEPQGQFQTEHEHDKMWADVQSAVNKIRRVQK